MESRGYAWGMSFAPKREWLTIAGSHWEAPELFAAPGDAVKRPGDDTLALVERWTHPGVSSGRCFKILEIVESPAV